MAFGLPIVHYGVAGTQDYFIDEVNSVLGETWDPVTTAFTLFKFLTNSSRLQRVGNDARAFVERFLSTNDSAAYANSVFRRMACQSQLRAAAEMALVVSAATVSGGQNASWTQLSVSITLLIQHHANATIKHCNFACMETAQSAITAVFVNCVVVLDVGGVGGRSLGRVELPYQPINPETGVSATVLAPATATTLSTWLLCPGQQQQRLFSTVSLEQ